jgi:hypothetical protein
MRQYTFNYVNQLTLVAIGISDDSLFDFGVSVSALSTNEWATVKMGTNIAIGTLLITTFFYVTIKKLIKALRKRGHTQLEEEVDDSDQQE